MNNKEFIRARETPFEDLDFSISDVLFFAMQSWKTIVSVGFMGAFFSATYLFFSPAPYEAITRIQLASSSERDIFLSNHLKGARPTISQILLMARLDDGLIAACATKDPAAAKNEAPLQFINLIMLKDSSSLIEIRVQRSTPESAKQCAAKISDFILSYQSSLISEQELLIEKAKEKKIKVIESRISNDKSALANFTSSRNGASNNYPALIKMLRDNEDSLEKLLSSEYNAPFERALVVLPITLAYGRTPSMTLFVIIKGLFLGLFLGFLLAFIRRWLKTKKS